MSDDFLRRYFYKKWRASESLAEKLEILYDFVISNEKYQAWFNIDIERIENMDYFELEDFMLEYEEELEAMWDRLLEEYDDFDLED